MLAVAWGWQTTAEWNTGRVPMKKLRARCKLWFDAEGVSVIGEGRATLLKAIDEYGSLSTAAKKIGISYRHAYSLISSLNSRCGRAVVRSSIGGIKGGGMELTGFGRQLIKRYESTKKELDKMLSESFSD